MSSNERTGASALAATNDDNLGEPSFVQSCSSTATPTPLPQEPNAKVASGEQIFAQCKAESQHAQRRRRASLDQAMIPNSIRAVVSKTGTPTHSSCSFSSPNTPRNHSSTALRRASDFSSRGDQHRTAILEECFGGDENENESISSLEVSLGDDYLDHDESSSSSSSSDDDENDDGKMAFERFKAAANYVVRGKSTLMMGKSSSCQHPLSEGTVRATGGGRIRRNGPVALVDNIPIRPASSHEFERESRWKADHGSHGGSSAESTFQGTSGTGCGDEQSGGCASQRRNSSRHTSVLAGLQRVVDLQNLLPPVNTTRRSCLTNISTTQRPKTLPKTQRVRAYSDDDLSFCEDDDDHDDDDYGDVDDSKQQQQQQQQQQPPRMPQRHINSRSSSGREVQQRLSSRQSRWSTGSEENSTAIPAAPQQKRKVPSSSPSGMIAICDVTHRVPLLVQHQHKKYHHHKSNSIGNWIRYGCQQQKEESRWTTGSEENSTATPSAPQQKRKVPSLSSSSGMIAICDVTHRVPILAQHQHKKCHHHKSNSIGNWIRYGCQQKKEER